MIQGCLYYWLPSTMETTWLFWWVGLFSLFVFPQESSGVELVNIGAIFSLQTIDGRASQFAMQAAVDEVNTDPSILGGRKLVLSIHDSNFSGFLGIIGALQFMEKNTVAIIGPQSSEMAHVLSNFGNRLHIPLLSFTALDPMLTTLQYPYFIQTAPNDFVLMKAIADLVSYYGWARITAIYTDDDQSRNGITVLGDKLAERRCKITYKAALSPHYTDADDDATLRAVLNNHAKMMESRVIVVHAKTAVGPRILKMAEELGMMVDGYVWIATTWLSTILDGQIHPAQRYNSSVQGVLTLRHHTPDSKRKTAFAAKWSHLTNGSNIGMTTSSLYAYDTVWMLALALKSFLSRGYRVSFSDDPELAAMGKSYLNLTALSNFNEGPKLLELLLETNMSGLTGHVQYMDKHRSLFQPSFDILNIAENQVRLVAYWSNSSGISVQSPDDDKLYNKPENQSSVVSQQLSTGVVWPGGTRKTPRGWVFPHDGRKLRIGIPFRASFQGFVYIDNHTNIVDGLCIDVFLAALKLLPYPVPFEYVYFGNGLQNPSYNELVRKITTDVIDAAVGDIEIVTGRTADVDFTQPYVESGLVVVAHIKKSNSSMWIFLQPFTASMWAVTITFFLVVGAVIWILEHRKNDEFRGPPKQQLLTIIHFSVSTMLFAHTETPVSTMGRMVLVIWLFVVLIIQSSYTASLTSFLTVQQLSSQINGIDSLLTSSAPIGFQAGSFAENYLQEVLSIPRRRLRRLNSPEEYAQALENGTVAAVIDEKPYIQFFLAKHCHFSIVGEEFTKGGWGFAFRRDSPIAVDMSTAILRLSEDGTLQSIMEKWRARMKPTCVKPESLAEGSDQLQLRNFIGLFVLSGFTCLIAVLLYFWKITGMYKSATNKLSVPGGVPPSVKVHVKQFVSFIDQREERRGKQLKKRKRILNEGGVGGSGSTNVGQKGDESISSTRRVGFCLPEENRNALS